MQIKRKNDGLCTVSECTLTFNRFGVKKKVVFEADDANEIRHFSYLWSGRVIRMTKEEYLELENA